MILVFKTFWFRLGFSLNFIIEMFLFQYLALVPFFKMFSFQFSLSLSFQNIWVSIFQTFSFRFGFSFGFDNCFHFSNSFCFNLAFAFQNISVLGSLFKMSQFWLRIEFNGRISSNWNSKTIRINRWGRGLIPLGSFVWQEKSTYSAKSDIRIFFFF